MIPKFPPAVALILAATGLHAATRHTVPMETGAPADIVVVDLTDDCTRMAKAVRVIITNNAPYPVSYVATLQSSSGEAVSRTIAVPANATRGDDITATLDPADSVTWMNTSVAFSGPGAKSGNTIGLSGGHSGKSFGTTRQVALSPQLHTHYASRLSKGYEAASIGYSCAELASFDISPDWRTLRAFDAMIFTGDEWRTAAARPDAREALLRYAGQGGHIRIISEAKDAPPALPGKGDEQTYGFGKFTVYRTDAESAVKAVEKSPSAASSSKNPFAADSLWNDSPASGSGYRALDIMLPAAARAGVGVMLIIALFSILVGPVNLFVFCRGAKRHRMLWLTPALAVGTSLLLCGYIVIADGVGGEGRRRRLRMRPAGANAEFVTQEQSSRTGLLLGSGFAVPEGALLWNQPKPDPTTSFRFNMKSPRIEADGRASGEWFRSRYTQSQSLEMWDAVRGGLSLGGTPDAPEILSSFDGTLEKIFVRSDDGRLWRTDKIAPGARARLVPATWTELGEWFGEVEKSCGKTQVNRLYAVKSSRNWYFAQSSNLCAASPETLASIRWKDLPDLLVGDLASDNTKTVAR